MTRNLNDVIAALPKARRDSIKARYRELRKEAESLAALRKAAGKAQVDVASKLGISQPSVSKIEKQTDMYLSTLRNYVQAIGGDLEFVVKFPEQQPVHLNGLGDVFESNRGMAKPKRLRMRSRKTARRA
ncbi:MAG TPA: XRE family transcriptional regulator [Rhizomicrobium sp.]|nr:XRE family transcriptional regulator [Rhizomicrobium sp.]